MPQPSSWAEHTRRADANPLEPMLVPEGRTLLWDYVNWEQMCATTRTACQTDELTVASV